VSTPADCAAFRAWAAMVPPPRAVLYLGPRDRDHLAVVRACWPWPPAVLTTLDADWRLKPHVCRDLDADAPLPGRWDVCVCASVLMYLADPAAACRRLLAACATLCVQEPVLRARPDADPWPDRWRFVGPGAPPGLVLRARREAGASGRGVCDLSGVGTLAHEAYYPDGGSVSGLWAFAGGG
jgi:hypothetical protein